MSVRGYVRRRFSSGCSYCLATTLWDQNQFPLATLSDAYHGRWGIEELYKISKRLVEIEQFHSKSERGVKQELYAHFVLLALSRSFGNQFEDDLNAGVAFDQPKMRANFTIPASVRMQVNPYQNCRYQKLKFCIATDISRLDDN